MLVQNVEMLTEIESIVQYVVNCCREYSQHSTSIVARFFTTFLATLTFDTQGEEAAAGGERSLAG